MSLRESLSKCIAENRYSNVIEAILSLPEFKEMQDNPNTINVKNLLRQLSLILSDLEVVEKCNCIEGQVVIDNGFTEFACTCEYCHGTGQITRPATAEEVREALVVFFREDTAYTFPLKSGAILRMKEHSNRC